MKQVAIWTSALMIGALLGCLGAEWLDDIMNFVASVYTRLFRLLAVPAIVLAVTTTLATTGRNTGRLFRRTLAYTLLTTTCAAAVGALVYVAVAPGNLPAEVVGQGSAAVADAPATSYSEHILSIVPDNVVRPFLEGNVLSLLLVAFAVGFGLRRLPDSERKAVLLNGITGLQELLFLLIGWLIKTLPIGIVAFAAQLSAQVSAGVAAESLGRYALVVLTGNAIQFFVVLPMFLLVRGLNPLHVFRQMTPAVLMALFTKSSAATLPVTMSSAEERLGVSKDVARFVLPICTTINMNGCAAFILITSLFVMQQGSMPIALSTILLWLVISVISAVGNAGVPMGCFFLTLSLMSGIGAPVAVLGLILPIYTIIDMVETAENVWSDSCVCAMTNHDLK